ncbi:MAG: glycoside hydrolase 100 family protein [bacterium]|nr:glycoside hydrolase 100 family protein [bacterium]
MDLTKQAYQKAIDVLKHCAKPAGFYASGLPGGYEAVWARDSMTTSLGAVMLGNDFKKTIAKSIALLAKNQGEMGQIPNCVGSYNTDRESDVTYNSVDSSLWFIIGNFIYARQYNDASLLKKYGGNIAAALYWLRAQDPDNVGLIAQQPTNDWQDAFPHKYGYTIHIHALYYAVLKMIGDNKRAEEVKKIINGEKRKYCSLYDSRMGYYYPWAWKSHDAIREHEEWFDAAGNLLAVITGLAPSAIAKKILNHIEKQKINRPYPCKAIWPPIKKGDKEWRDYFALCDAREPFHYLNGGVWPFIGGLYIAALVKMKQFKKAQAELELLAKANSRIIKNPSSPDYIISSLEKKRISGDELKKMRQKEFNEWLDGKTGEPMGEPYQAWSAGMYIYAYECVKRKRALFF